MKLRMCLRRHRSHDGLELRDGHYQNEDADMSRSSRTIWPTMDVKRMDIMNRRGIYQDISQQTQDQQLSKKEKLLLFIKQQLANSKPYLEVLSKPRSQSIVTNTMSNYRTVRPYFFLSSISLRASTSASLLAS